MTQVSSEPIDARIARRTRDRRHELGLRRQDLAVACGVTSLQILKYESGVSQIPASRLWRLASALDVPVSYFFDAPQRNGLESRAHGPRIEARSFDLGRARVHPSKVDPAPS